MDSEAAFEEMATRMLTTMVTVEKLKREAEKAFNDHDYQVAINKLNEASGIVALQPGATAQVEQASILLPLSTVYRTVGDTKQCEVLYKQIIALCTETTVPTGEAKFGSSQVDGFMEQMMPGMDDMVAQAHHATRIHILGICAEYYQQLLKETDREKEAEELKKRVKHYLG